MKAILFDWDGTIVDSMPAIFETDRAICVEFGIELDLQTFRRTFSPNWRRMYRTLGIPDERTHEAVAIWARTFDSGATRLFEGVDRSLAELAAAGYVLGLVTSGSREEIEPQLARHRLDELLSVRVYGEDTVAGKPYPDPLLVALDAAGGLTPAQARYVGDSLDDMRMAAGAGVPGVGIVSMLATSEELLAAGATETALSVTEWADRLLAGSTR
jgi:HAD superfamily hydrolase (TIGR01549 family)